ncbi:cryptochrome/photolyase family protein [Catelliglobosispora koreensis]|uniref:cryptochrome/photolyase family protein n=1 Tax=Catelliglobosispora koreensis TaxID=129052 RepID=UPI0003792AC7|nr:deoxyribodipyrimidine photo-lyase [Catelliglobosispora koreensis]
MRTIVMLFTRDLRVHDNPALAAASAHAEQVVPLFVLDPAIAAPSNRQRFLLEALDDLRKSLRDRGSDLLIRHGDPVAETVKVAQEFGATGIAMTEDYSAYARRRQERLRLECDQHRLALRTFPGVTIVPPGEVRPSTGGDHYKIFTPYHRAWQGRRWRELAQTPERLASPKLPRSQLKLLKPSPHWTGGETEALRRLADWRPKADSYADGHDDLAGDRTSRLSPYLHFGCLSPLMLATSGMPDAFVRQLCWRDFYHQALAAFPAMATKPFRPGALDVWPGDDSALEAWKAGETGVPIVDAGMRQLAGEGWMHNRARLITASYLTKTLGVDWRAGAAWFAELLVDADVANNFGNWQWVAGTGTDTKPYRKFSPARQAQRFDPAGAYVHQWAPDSGVDLPQMPGLF